MPANQIQRAYVRHYSDNGQTNVYIEWANGATTEGPARKANELCPCCSQRLPANLLIARRAYHVGAHMAALIARAERGGITVEFQEW